MREKPRLSFGQIWNMSFGFLGIQFGWGLQLANMSAIYTYLGAKESDIPLLWLAGPVTGLAVQPIIGAMSDRTWNWLGRRRPYFLVGAVLASIALFVMPDSTSVRMAASLLWVLDASINISMEPFRAFVADKLNDDQRTAGFVMQSFFIGVGATLANALPYIFRYFGVEGRTPSGIPLTVQYSFKLGAAAFILAVLWTVFTSKEYPPEDIEAFERMRAEQRGFIATITALLREIASAIAEMPATMRQLAVVQFFTWLGLFCMWLFFGLMTSYHVFGATSDKDRLFPLGGEWGGICFMVYSVVTFVVAFLLPGFARKTSRKTVYAISLVCGGVGLLLTYFIQDKYALLLTMVGVGIAWASILSMPYAILSGALPPARMGIYMGVFNFFIVLPEITQALTFGPIIRAVFGAENHNAPLYMVMTGGVFLLLAAALVSRVEDVSGDVRERAVIRGDEEEPVLVQHSVQPVPSTGLLDDEGKRRRD
jgi:maltose/moltooligosaccharide transporter